MGNKPMSCKLISRSFEVYCCTTSSFLQCYLQYLVSRRIAFLRAFSVSFSSQLFQSAFLDRPLSFFERQRLRSLRQKDVQDVNLIKLRKQNKDIYSNNTNNRVQRRNKNFLYNSSVSRQAGCRSFVVFKPSSRRKAGFKQSFCLHHAQWGELGK